MAKVSRPALRMSRDSSRQVRLVDRQAVAVQAGRDLGIGIDPMTVKPASARHAAITTPRCQSPATAIVESFSLGTSTPYREASRRHAPPAVTLWPMEASEHARARFEAVGEPS